MTTARRYLVDSDVLIDGLRKVEGAGEYLDSLGDWSYSIASGMELFFGARSKKEMQAIAKSLASYQRIGFSRSLPVAVTIALNTCMRLSEIRLLRWSQLDFLSQAVTVGKSKTDAGTGRVIPMNDTLVKSLLSWASQFPERKRDEHVFPFERYGAAGDDFLPCVYDTDPTKPIGSWKEAWEKARKDSGVGCRFHDLRHTGCTRMLEGGVPFPVVSELMGWSPATTIRMAKRYGHIGQQSLRNAVNALSEAMKQYEIKQAEQAQKKAENPSGSFDNPFALNTEADFVVVN